MKKILIVISFLTCFGVEYLAAQGRLEVICTNKNYIFNAKEVNGFGIVFTVTDAHQRKKDTTLVSRVDETVNYCFCNDTLVAFYCENTPSPRIWSFKMIGGTWKINNTIDLPEKFPMVGVLQEGKRYEKYEHNWISLDKVVSKLTVKFYNKEKRDLIPIEKYEIEYKLDYNYDNSYKGAFNLEKPYRIVSKKVLRE